MQTLTQMKYLRAAIKAEKARGKRITLVPTMGNLHEGHLQLVRRAHQVGDIVVVSIFVNPLQFGAAEDLDNYPKTLAEDQEKLEKEEAHYLFLPSVEEMYPNGMDSHTTVNIEKLSNMLCGISRPGHFLGVCTIVSKLFNLVQPDSAIFGEKDFQQLTIIKRMTSDLCMPIDIVGMASARAHDGLALSSRNSYLSSTDRARAPSLYETLQQARDDILAGNLPYKTVCDAAIEKLRTMGFNVDYFEARDQQNLALLDSKSDSTKIVILAAAKLGSTRLLDNISLTLN